MPEVRDLLEDLEIADIGSQHPDHPNGWGRKLWLTTKGLREQVTESKHEGDYWSYGRGTESVYRHWWGDKKPVKPTIALVKNYNLNAANIEKVISALK